MSGENILTYQVNDLKLNEEYHFRVKAVNKVGSGPFLELRNPVITMEVKQKPDPPIDVEAHDPTANSITLTWKPPVSDGGCAITGYILESIEKDGDRFQRINPSLVPGFTYVVKDLKEGKEYQFRVRAENAAGVSEPSRSTPLTMIAAPVEKPKVSLHARLQPGLCIRKGEEIRLDAYISGAPYPTVTWLRNNEDIKNVPEKKPVLPILKKKKGGKVEPEEPEVFVTPLHERLSYAVKKGETSIMVRDSIRTDHGRFCIQAENSHG
uniref:Titin n=1 Tax=Hucho hucho TaxID=62062 RepID=A0A4W5MN86_9TELE